MFGLCLGCFIQALQREEEKSENEHLHTVNKVNKDCLREKGLVPCIDENFVQDTIWSKCNNTDG